MTVGARSGWLAALAALALVFTACGDSGGTYDDDGPIDDSGQDAVVTTPSVSLSTDADLGDYLVDGEGITLYVNINDTQGVDGADPVSACIGGCLLAWPIYVGGDDLEVGDDLDAADLGTYVRADGETQATFNGWPLYYFGGDQAPGDVAGHGVGAIWYAAGTDLPTEDELADTPTVTEEVHDELGAYVADGEGRTLYIFLNDTKGTADADPVSACTDGCLTTWPIFYAAEILAGEGVDAADFGQWQRPDGAWQTTYKGWPLHSYAGDAYAGDVNGHGATWIAAGTPIPEPEEPVEADIELAEDADLGAYLTNANGWTLYVFLNDTKGTADADPVSACTDGCLDTWPAWYAADLEVGEGLDAADFDAWQRADGSWQTTYKGWPLYTYSGDVYAGDVNGHGTTWIAAGTPIAAPEEPTDVAIGLSADAGEHLTDTDGYALYINKNDTKASTYYDPASSCSDGCLTTWPAFYVDAPALADGLGAADFDTFQRADGSWQTTYKGWPLYRYAGDTEPGMTSGHGTGPWEVATP